MIEHILPHFPSYTYPLTLALHAFFPDLAYPVVRALSPAQRWQLSQSPPPPRRLGRQGTVEFLLRRVFAADLDALRQPTHLVAWLDQVHGGGRSHAVVAGRAPARPPVQGPGLRQLAPGGPAGEP
jgi:hypothetical protein